MAVCIPEYLSVYETERLCQELAKSDIDIQNIVVNQIVLPEGDCKKCNARYKMQWKYLKQIADLYSDFHVTLSALQNDEIKGVEGLRQYGQRLLSGLVLPGPPA